MKRTIFAMTVAWIFNACVDVGSEPVIPISELKVVATNVTNVIYKDKKFYIEYILIDANGNAVLDDHAKVELSINTPSDLETMLMTTACSPPSRDGSSILVIVDDSSSMLMNDPMLKRRDAVLALLRKVRPDAEVLLVDFVHSRARNLVCAAQQPGASTKRLAGAFSDQI
jgi:hypothetical protein